MLFFLPWGPKVLQMQNLGGRFVVFILMGPKSQLYESQGLKLQLSLKKSKF